MDWPSAKARRACFFNVCLGCCQAIAATIQYAAGSHGNLMCPPNLRNCDIRSHALNTKIGLLSMHENHVNIWLVEIAATTFPHMFSTPTDLDPDDRIWYDRLREGTSNVRRCPGCHAYHHAAQYLLECPAAWQALA